MTGPEMVAHAKALGAVIVCEDNGHTYPATLTYWHLTGRHKGRARVALANDEHKLRGKNLACWCPLDQPCHADVILELANGVQP